MSERTTSRVIPRLDPNDSIPLLTEVFELPDAGTAAPAAAAQEGVIDTFGMADSGLVMHVGDTGDAVADEGAAPASAMPADSGAPGEDDLRAVRTELLTRVMMRFRTEWPQVVAAHTEATLQSRLAPLTAQLASELTQSLEARLVEWLDATLEEIEKTPGED
ncbi:DUF2486 domain-containing protein [Cupriavidus necator]|uniref:DUF2486 family protein n=1 Tax=Cupriavidus necator (strain ATCC 17699 / DSM 428 / KCTC 22496 / NCIMB 10442 / H16 / Stanier 337) TaxID=381666 RepID=Q0K7F7_CUPNH|nr:MULTISPECIES: hypothetical protein [Cupriavidus]EON15787.1 hypothetical protein C265_30626 [Cupriavidus sp. GA3-3]KUE87697.1 hypothetical protein ASL20_16945 [Cupriavidus necator]QCC01829.1 hypothetical protein E6A55_15235 [Cupriavidus necator H16]QQB75340.1 hypothetical protein I6H87_10900 [Cupriavidus necator]WKA40230.1 hypothetical protein QWP09_15275 [Cupriavidus necator]